jgi:SAM-dependent methyltransferase
MSFPPIAAWRAPPYRALDVGCGNGSFLESMRRLGWMVEGQEWDPRAAEAARERGLTVHVGPLDELDIRVDLVTMRHVLEHVADPVAFLRAANHVLEPGGFVYATTPNLLSAGHATFGRAWRGLEPPRHLHLFTGTSLQLAAHAAGHVDVKVVQRYDEDKLILESSAQLARALSTPAPTQQPPKGPQTEHEVIGLIARKPHEPHRGAPIEDRRHRRLRAVLPRGGP